MRIDLLAEQRSRHLAPSAGGQVECVMVPLGGDGVVHTCQTAIGGELEAALAGQPVLPEVIQFSGNLFFRQITETKVHRNPNPDRVRPELRINRFSVMESVLSDLGLNSDCQVIETKDAGKVYSFKNLEKSILVPGQYGIAVRAVRSVVTFADLPWRKSESDLDFRLNRNQSSSLLYWQLVEFLTNGEKGYFADKERVRSDLYRYAELKNVQLQDLPINSGSNNKMPIVSTGFNDGDLSLKDYLLRYRALKAINSNDFKGTLAKTRNDLLAVIGLESMATRRKNIHHRIGADGKQIHLPSEVKPGRLQRVKPSEVDE